MPEPFPELNQEKQTMFLVAALQRQIFANQFFRSRFLTNQNRIKESVFFSRAGRTKIQTLDNY